MNVNTGIKQALILAIGIIVLGFFVDSGLKSLAGKDRKNAESAAAKGAVPAAEEARDGVFDVLGAANGK